MGRQSNLTVEQRTEAVLSLLRREEPAGKIARRYGVACVFRFSGPTTPACEPACRSSCTCR